jgi:hypothetical protein
MLAKPYFVFSLGSGLYICVLNILKAQCLLYMATVKWGNPEGRRPLGRPRRRWEDNIKMDLREVGWEGMDWINLAQDRDRWRALVNAVMNLRVS